MAAVKDHANVVILPPSRSRSASARRGSPTATGLRPSSRRAGRLAARRRARRCSGSRRELWALVLFRRARTSILPIRPTSAIIEAGPYRYSRNPIYVGMFVIVVGAAIALDSLWQFAALAALYVMIRWGVVAREEAYLTRSSARHIWITPKRVRRWI